MTKCARFYSIKLTAYALQTKDHLKFLLLHTKIATGILSFDFSQAFCANRNYKLDLLWNVALSSIVSLILLNQFRYRGLESIQQL